jgi:hypothetical protein
MLNGTKHRTDIMSKVRKAEWDIMSNGTKRRMEIMSKVRKANWDKMLNGKKMSKVRNVESEGIMSKMVKMPKVPFGVFFHSMFLTIRRFVPVNVFPFDVLSHSAFCLSTFCHSTFLLSAFVTSTFCR